MIELQKRARWAGILYLVTVLTGLFNLVYTPGQLMVRGDAAATAVKVLAHQTLYRIDIVVGLFSNLIFLFLVLALYRLFKEVDRQQAKLMVILVLVQIPQSFVCQMLQIGAFELIRGADYLSVFDQIQRDALAMFCFRVNDLGTYVSNFFWGVWLFPLGVLVYRSKFIPRFLGVWIVVNGIAYVAISVTGILFPEQSDLMSKITFPALLGELALMVGLLVRGVRPVSATPEKG
jgi:hypothetical protein